MYGEAGMPLFTAACPDGPLAGGLDTGQHLRSGEKIDRGERTKHHWTGEAEEKSGKLHQRAPYLRLQLLSTVHCGSNSRRIQQHTAAK
jgi:hypothetical protein